MVLHSPGLSKKATNTEDRCVLVFVRAPEPGKVKTRLARRLDPEIALHLHCNFTLDILRTLAKGGWGIVVCHHPPDAESRMQSWLGRSYDFQPQKGRDLGERMAGAFTRCFQKGFGCGILIGTDFPDLPVDIIVEAFNGLDKGGSTIGPSRDGGYYLIGFKKETFTPAVFQNIPWGTQDVFERTVEYFKQRRKPLHILPLWRDIDTYEDLMDFIRTQGGRETAAPHTMRYLVSIGLVPSDSDHR